MIKWDYSHYKAHRLSDSCESGLRDVLAGFAGCEIPFARRGALARQIKTLKEFVAFGPLIRISAALT